MAFLRTGASAVFAVNEEEDDDDDEEEDDGVNAASTLAVAAELSVEVVFFVDRRGEDLSSRAGCCSSYQFHLATNIAAVMLLFGQTDRIGTGIAGGGPISFFPARTVGLRSRLAFLHYRRSLCTPTASFSDPPSTYLT